MKKIRLMAIALLAGSLGLASCGKEEPADNNPGEQQTVKKVNSVAISSENDVDAIKVGEKLQLTATVEEEGGAAKTVSWKSSDTSVATVSSKGLVTAKKAADEVIITATSTVDKTKSATFSLTINEADGVVSVTIIGAEDGDQVKVADSIFLGTQVAVTGDASKEVVWETSNSSIATVSQSGMVTGVDEGTVTITAKAKDDISKSDTVTLTIWCDPQIISVTVSGEPENNEVVIGLPITMTATVTKKGAAKTGVTWTSSDTSVAKINADGVITPVSTGTFTVTATSVEDGTKSATSRAMTVVDHGYFPTLYEEGFVFSEAYPETAVNTFAGTTLPAMPDLEGFYVLEEEADAEEKTPASLTLIAEYTQANKQAAAAYFLDEANGYVYFYDSYNEEDCFIDATQKVQINFGAYYLDEGKTMAAIVIAIYHTEDLWKTSANTTDVAWNEDVTGKLTDAGFTLPFIPLGAAYDGFVYSDGTVEVSDYSCDFTKLEGYGAILEGAGFTAIEVTEGEGEEEYTHTEYVTNLDAYRDEHVYFDFTQYGNTIQVWYELVELEAFPTVGVSMMLEEIGTKYTVPEYTGSEELRYTFDAVDLDLGGEDPVLSAWVDVLNTTETELDAYIELLKSEGNEFVVDEEQSYVHEEGQDATFLQKGKLCIVVVKNYLVREATDAEIAELMDADPSQMTEDQLADYYLKAMEYNASGTFTVYDYDTLVSGSIVVFGDEAGMEDPGLYVYESKINVGLGKTSALTVIHYEIDEQLAVTFESSDPEVATVDANGVVTGVSEGTAVITASIADTAYSDTVAVTVAKNMANAYDGLNAWLASEEIDPVELPAVPTAKSVEFGYDDEYDCYSIAALVSDYYADYDFAYACNEMGYVVEEGEDYDYWVELDDLELHVYLGKDKETGEYYLCIDANLVEPELASTTFDIAELGTLSGSQDGFSYAAAKAGGQNDPIINNKNELRLVVNSTLTISSSGDPITSIFISFNNCGEEKAVGSLTASVGTVTEVDGGILWEGNATSVVFTATGRQVHIEYIEINGGGEGGGGGSVDVGEALDAIEDIAVEIAAKYLSKSESSITVSYDEYDADVAVFDYSDYGFIYADFSIDLSGSESSMVAAMKAALPQGCVLDEENTYEKEGYHDIWYTYGDYSIGIYYDGDMASISVVPTEMYDIYYYNMYS